MEDLYKASLPEKSSKFHLYIQDIVSVPSRGYKIRDWAYLDLAKVQLLEGDYAQGWKNFEARFWSLTKMYENGYLKFPFPVWQGASIAGKTILVYPELGPGRLPAFRPVPSAPR
jgi:hypothetical protein